MSKEQLVPLNAEARSMLDVERDRPDAPDNVRNRVFEHIATSIAVGVGPAGGNGPGAAGGHRLGSSARMFSGINRRTASLLLGTAIVGGGVGAATHAWLAAPHAPAHVAPTPTPAPVATGTGQLPRIDVEAPPLAPASPPMPAIRPSAAPAIARDVAGKDVELGMERALIERARMAGARGDTASELEALDRHARDFPAGRLTEDREALAVQALVVSGRIEEARARAVRFRARFPSSVFLAAVNAAVGGHPEHGARESGASGDFRDGSARDPQLR
jgi:hypothetical protein